MKKNITFVIAMALMFVTVCGCAFSSRSSAVLKDSETELGDYQKDVTGGFSYRWIAYIIEPEEDAQDQNVYVDLNGQRLGPYTNISRCFQLDDSGEHIAYAAAKDGRWVIVVDGKEKWTYDNLKFTYHAWMPDMEGKAYTPQTSAVNMQFSPDGKHIAYTVMVDDSTQVMYQDGQPGDEYSGIGNSFGFADGKILYWAKDAQGKYFYIHGDQTFGPYDGISNASTSSNRKHYVFSAESNGSYMLVADDTVRVLNGSATDFDIGPSGELAYSERVRDAVKLYYNDQAQPGEYDEVTELTLSPDGKHLAFWAKTGEEWAVQIDDRALSGFGGYYYYEINGIFYSILWNADSSAIAYFTKNEGDENDATISLNGQEPISLTLSGIGYTVYFDSENDQVGMGFLFGMPFNRQALIAYLLKSERPDCDPFLTTLIKGKMAYIEEVGDTESYIVIGDEKEGPYASLATNIGVSEDEKHYFYFVNTDLGKQAVIDGKMMDRVYEAIYLPQIVENLGVGYLGVKDGKVYSVFHPYP